jgi:hypothetical protein
VNAGVALVRYVEQYRREMGFGPTMREIAQHLGFVSTNGVRYWMQRMKERGALDWDPRKSRTIRTTATRTRSVESALPAVPVFTRDGEFVVSLGVMPFNRQPEILEWGARRFVRSSDGFYREAFAFVVVAADLDARHRDVGPCE